MTEKKILAGDEEDGYIETLGSSAEKYSKPESFRPRDYQIELFNIAKKKNTIAILESGTGKTFVAIMLMKHMVAKERSLHRPKKLIFFLVNLVPLVFQQSFAIHEQTFLRVGRYCGEMKVDLWKEIKWKRIFDQLDVLVMTCQIFYDILMHGFLSLEDVSLIVFDECHHAKRNHPYNRIMKEFYFPLDKCSRPKILGLTASPCQSRGSIDFIQELEYNLDATSYKPNIGKHFYIHNEIPLEYSRSLKGHPGPLYNTFKSLESFDKEWANFSQRVDHILLELGVWAVERFLFLELSSSGILSEMYSNINNSGENINLVGKSLDNIKQFPSWKNYVPMTISEDVVSHKICLLFKVLHKEYQEKREKFCCILFVERRVNARLLTDLIRNSKLRKFIKCDFLVGHGGCSVIDTCMKSSKQISVVRDFRMGKINLLVTTAVGEEGLDIQPCSTVIRFDMFTTLVGYIQSRGRARDQNSKYLIFFEKDNLRQREIYFDCKRLEKEMADKLLIERFEDIDLADEYIDDEDNEFYINELTGAKLSYNSSISVLYYYCAKLSAYHHCSQAKPEFIEEGESSYFKCTVFLPSFSPVKSAEGKLLRSKKLAKMSAAFEMCKLLHSKMQINDHFLPNNLEKFDDEEKDDVHMGFSSLLEGMVLGDHSTLGEPPKKDKEWTPVSPWEKISSTNTKFNVFIFSTDYYETHSGKNEEFMPLGIVYGGDLPDIPKFPVYLPTVENHLDSEKTEFEFKKSHSVELDEQEIYMLRRFNTIIMRYVYLSHRDEMDRSDNHPKYLWENVDLDGLPDDYLYFFAPIYFGKIDWDTIKYVDGAHQIFQNSLEKDIWTVMQKVQQEYPEQSKRHLFTATDVLDYARRVIIEDVRHDLNVTCQFDENQTFLQRYKIRDNLTKSIPYMNTRLKVRKDVPLVKIQKGPLKRNYLRPVLSSVETAKEKTKLPDTRITDFLIFSPIPSSLLKSSVLMPAFLTRIESLFMAIKFREDHGFHEIPLYLLLEALTAPGCAMGYSYERLEILGDGFLKAALSLHLYVTNPLKNEGSLSFSRHVIVSNKNLYEKGVSINLPQYIYNSKIMPKNWRIPLTDAVDQKIAAVVNIASKHTKYLSAEKISEIAGTSNFISDGTVADVVESLLGAAYLSGGVSLGLKMANYLGIPLNETETWNSYLPALRNVMLETDEALAKEEENNVPYIPGDLVAESVGYRFQNENLAIEALNHSSSQFKSFKTYERLEYLGDAILDFLIVRELFKINVDINYETDFPTFIPFWNELSLQQREQFDVSKMELDPGRITDLKMSIVNNETLAFISSNIGLGKFLLHFSDPLSKVLTVFSRWASSLTLENNIDRVPHLTNMPWWWFKEEDSLEEKDFRREITSWKHEIAVRKYEEELDEVEEADDVFESTRAINEMNGTPDENSTKVLSVEEIVEFLPQKFLPEPPACPKVLSDIFEAIIGGIFLDCDLNLETTWKVVDKCISFSRKINQEMSEPVEEKFEPVDIQCDQVGQKQEAEDIEGEIVSEKFNGMGSFLDWIQGDSLDMLYKRLNPKRKLMEWIDSRLCKGLDKCKLPYRKSQIEESKIAALVDTSETDFELKNFPELYYLENARKLTELDTPFFRPTVALYLHGILIGISDGYSAKLADAYAFKQGLLTLQEFQNNSLGLVEASDGSVKINVNHDGLKVRSKCLLCNKNNKISVN